MPDDKKLDQLCALAEAALDEGEFETALRHANAILSLVADDADGHVLKAEALSGLDRWDEAEQMLIAATDAHPDDPVVWLARAGVTIDADQDDHDRVEQALAMVEQALDKIGPSDSEDDAALRGEAARIAGRAYSALGDIVAAAEALEEARDQLGDEDPDLAVEVAVAYFEVLRFDAARDILEGLQNEGTDDPRVFHHLALLAEREGKDTEAARLFAQAHAIDPDSHPEPVTLSRQEFDAAVELGLARLPTKIRDYLENVPVMVEDLPQIEDLRGDPPLSPLSLGMFRGPHIREKSVMDPWSELPSSILLFQRNLERFARSRRELIDEVEVTLLHEVGHYLGLDEDDLYARGLD